MNCAPRQNKKKTALTKILAKKINIPSLEVELQELSIAFFSFNVSLMRQNSSLAQTQTQTQTKTKFADHR